VRFNLPKLATSVSHASRSSSCPEFELPDTTSETTNVAALGDSDGGKSRIEMCCEGARDIENKWRMMFGKLGAGLCGSDRVRVGEKTVGASYLWAEIVRSK
jgi:hypothetical protein